MLNKRKKMDEEPIDVSYMEIYEMDPDEIQELSEDIVNGDISVGDLND